MAATRHEQLLEKARAFDEANPIVWGLFRRFTFEVIDSGKSHFGVGAIWERLRWEMAFATKTADGFKLNNNHRAYYARKFMARYPQHAGFFRTRAPSPLRLVA